jgi:TRAP-type C4-dicarboxylate transport system substrate-binding protein
MNPTGRSKRRCLAAALTALVLVLAGCAAGARDRAGGGAADQPRVLTFAQPNRGGPGSALQRWADQVHLLSKGTLRIDFTQGWRLGQPDYEGGTIADVRAGKVDLAGVGARAFDRVGVTDFQGLLAPMLVDSQALQEKVFAAGIPDQMLRGVERSGVVGLGVLPGPMRKVLGVSRPFLRPSDFTGAVIGMQDSDLTARTLSAWGATPKAVPNGAALTGLDGYEQQLGSIAGNSYADSAGYVTANVDLWPRPLVLIAGPAQFATLSGDQQRALRAAAAPSSANALRAARSEDETAAATLCRRGMTLASASPQDLQALTDALQPVYDRLDAEPRTRAWIHQIRNLKSDLGAGPDAPTCAGQQSPPESDPIPDGTYEKTVTRDDARKFSIDEAMPYDETVYRMVLTRGVLRMYDLFGGPEAPPELGWAGTYRVYRDRLEITGSGTTVTDSVAWSLHGKELTLKDMVTSERNNDGVAIWTCLTWLRRD